MVTAKSHEHVGRFALMSILSSTIPIVYNQNTRTAIDYSGKIIHTKKQGGRVGRCSAKPDTRRKPPEGAAPTADQMRSHLDLDLMATLSVCEAPERFFFWMGRVEGWDGTS